MTSKVIPIFSEIEGTETRGEKIVIVATAFEELPVPNLYPINQECKQLISAGNLLVLQ